MKRKTKWLSFVLLLSVVTNNMAVYGAGDVILPSPIEETASDTVELAPTFPAVDGEEIVEWREDGVRHYYVGDGTYQAVVTAPSATESGDAAVASTGLNTSVFQDTNVSSFYPSSCYGTNSYMTLSDSNMIYMKCSQPELPAYAHVESAELHLWYTASGTSGTLKMKMYTVNFSWDESSLNWNTANSHDNFGMDTDWTVGAGLGVQSSPKELVLNITTPVKRWYGENPRTNHGFALKRIGGDITTGSIVSSEGPSAYRPYAVITYSLDDLPIAEGTYYIRNGYHHNLFMSSKTTANDWDDNLYGVTSGDAYSEMYDPPVSPSASTDTHYKWNFMYLNNGYYAIRCCADASYLTVRSGQENAGNQILVLDQNFQGFENQQWKITETQDGRYKIEPRSSEAYTTDWVMAVVSGNDDLVKGYNVVQAANSGTVHSEWYIQSTNLNSRMSLNVTIERDVLSGQDYTDAALLAEFQSASYAFLLMYGIRLNVTIEDIKTKSNIAVNSQCNEIGDRNAICGNACGLEDECPTEHHKHGGNFFAIGLSSENRVCRVVGFALCGSPKGVHGNILGMTHGSNGNKEFVVSTQTEVGDNENFARTIQHELAHTFGTRDHDHVIGSGTLCIMTDDFGYWCSDCYKDTIFYVTSHSTTGGN